MHLKKYIYTYKNYVLANNSNKLASSFSKIINTRFWYMGIETGTKSQDTLVGDTLD